MLEFRNLSYVKYDLLCNKQHLKLLKTYKDEIGGD